MRLFRELSQKELSLETQQLITLFLKLLDEAVQRSNAESADELNPIYKHDLARKLA